MLHLGLERATHNILHTGPHIVIDVGKTFVRILRIICCNPSFLKLFFIKLGLVRKPETRQFQLPVCKGVLKNEYDSYNSYKSARLLLTRNYSIISSRQQFLFLASQYKNTSSP